MMKTCECCFNTYKAKIPLAPKEQEVEEKEQEKYLKLKEEYLELEKKYGG